MSDDIEEIRRKILRWASLVSSVQQEKDLREAAAALERLTADVTQQADALRQEKDEIERLREENRKLRAALSQQYATTASLLRSDQMPLED